MNIKDPVNTLRGLLEEYYCCPIDIKTIVCSLGKMEPIEHVHGSCTIEIEFVCNMSKNHRISKDFDRKLGEMPSPQCMKSYIIRGNYHIQGPNTSYFSFLLRMPGDLNEFIKVLDSELTPIRNRKVDHFFDNLLKEKL